jgi:transforming growth factor-beta-induced protein
LSTLLSLVVLAGLDGTLAAPGELTLVAPTNDAFTKLEAEVVDFLISDDGLETLTDILLYHVFPVIFVSDELSDGLTIVTLEGGTVIVSVGDEGVFFNDAEAAEVDILANNGVVHKIDTVLDLSDRDLVIDPGPISFFVANNPDLTTLTAAVIRAGLVDALSAITLFAPNNDAFDKVPPEILDQLFFDDNFIPQLQDLLLLHAIPDFLTVAELELAPVVIGLNGEEVSIEFPPLTVKGNNVVDGDNSQFDGIVHIIDGVLIPSWVFNSLADRVFANDDLSTLFSLLVMAGIDLSGPAALTVVGPTNDAFGLLDPADIEFLTSPEGLADLKRILQYHVFFGILTSSILVDGLVSTVEGSLVGVSTGPTLMFNQATAVEIDILGDNGVLHKIDQVLDPADDPQ